MPDFTYVVIDNAGKQKKGNIQAANEEEAKGKLKSDGLMIVNIEKASMMTKEINISFGSAVKPRDLSVFCRQFVSMINAGVTILDTLEMLSAQTENKVMAKAIKGVHGEIQKGENFSDAIAKYPKVFPSIMVSMIAAGEASGKIDVAFERMSAHFEKSAKLNAIVKKAAVYPVMLLVVSIIVVIIMLVKVIPSYKDMFDQLGTDLPWITQMMVTLSNGIINNWYIIILVVAAVAGGIYAFKQTTPGQIFFGTVARKMPVFGELTIKSAASNFSRTLSTLIYSGLPMIEALGITAGTMSNYLYKEAIKNAKEEVAKGIQLSEPIESCGLFPSMVSHMTRIGEETGDLEGMLTKLADYYDEEVEMATQTVIAALEPMIILVLAGVVGILIAAIMMPMVSMYDAMDSL